MTVWTCLQIDYDLNREELARGLLGEISPEEAARLNGDGVYHPTHRLELADDISDLAACEALFAAGNGAGPNADLIERLKTGHSISMGDLARNEKTGAIYLCVAIGWRRLP